MAATGLREASLCDKSKQDTLLQSIFKQKQHNRFCDVLMKVCNREIYAHSNVLAAASPYFDTFLGQELPRQFSQRSPQIIEIQVDGSEPSQLYEDAVGIVIDFLYTGLMTIRSDNVSQIYEISKIMQLGNIVSFCEDFLQGKAEHGTLYTIPQNSKVHTTAVNTDVSALHGTLELWNTWSKASKDRGLHVVSDIQFNKARCKKLVSVSVQTTPIVRQVITTNLSQAQVPVKKCNFSSYLKMANRKRPLEPADNTLDKAPGEQNQSDSSGNDKLQQSCKKVKLESSKIKEKNDMPKIVTRSGRVVVPKKWNSIEGIMDDVILRKLIKVEGIEEGSSLEVAENSEVSMSQNKENECDTVSTTDVTQHFAKNASNETVDITENGDLESQDSPEAVHLDGPQKEVDQASDSGSVASDTDFITLHPEGSDKALSDSEKVNSENSNSDDNEETSGEDADTDIENIIIKRRGRPKKVIIRTDMIKQEPGIEKSSKEYSCSECSFVTSRVREMSAHTMGHKRDQGICFYCDKPFSDKKELVKHSSAHKGPTPFKCLQCGVHFKTRTMLNLHLPKHSDVKPFRCELCSMAFKWKHALKNHMVVHSNKREHLCDICGYSTAHKAQLRSHSLIHTGDTFKCPFPGCNFETTKKQNLKYHGVTHTRERPHQCEICGQNFSLLKNMKRHMRLHYTDRQHRCTSCDFSSTRFDKLKEHLLKQHGSGTPPERRVKVAEMVSREYSLEAQPDPLVVSPVDQNTESGALSPSSKKASGETFTILTHLLEGETAVSLTAVEDTVEGTAVNVAPPQGEGIVGTSVSLTTSQAEGIGGTVVSLTTAQGGQMEYVEETQPAEQKDGQAALTDQVVVDSNQLSAAPGQAITADPVTAEDLDHLQDLEEVNSILVTEDGSQVILNAPSFTLQELASVLRQNEESSKLVPVSVETPNVTTSALSLEGATDSLSTQVPLHIVKEEDPKGVQYLEVLVDTAGISGMELQGVSQQ